VLTLVLTLVLTPCLLQLLLLLLAGPRGVGSLQHSVLLLL
jgi:hypothetical protein